MLEFASSKINQVNTVEVFILREKFAEKHHHDLKNTWTYRPVQQNTLNDADS